MAYFYDPPYFLMLAGFLIAIASGTAFKATLVDNLNQWSKNRSSRLIANLQGIELFLPFLGISIGVCLFLAAGLGIFGFPISFTWQISVPLTLLSAWLVWSQLAKLLVQLEQGGSKALDLDSL